MRRISSVVIALACLATLTVLPYSTPSAVAVPSVSAPLIVDSSLVPGTKLNLTISVENIASGIGSDLYAWEIHLNYNDSILQVTHSTRTNHLARIFEGPALLDQAQALGGQTLFSADNSTAGGVASANDFLILGTPEPPGEGFVGTGDIVYIEVQVLATGCTPLTFSNTLLESTDGNRFIPIEFTNNNGVFANVQCDQPPIASFTFTSPVIAGNPVTFDGSASSDRDGTVVKWQWNFGDGSPIMNMTVPIIVHTYASETGSHHLSVTLNVTDNAGLTNSTTASFDIELPNLLPQPIFTFSPNNPKKGESVTFDASGTRDPDDKLDSLPHGLPYFWNFGDGQTTGTSNPKIMHTYSLGGTFTVTLTAKDERGATNATSAHITVTGELSPTNASSGFPFWIIPAGAVGGGVVAATVYFVLKRRRPEEVEV